VATLAGILFVLPVDLAAGNLFSIVSPSRVEAGVFGRQRASLTTVLASFGIRAALFGVGGITLWFSRSYRNSWMELMILWLPAVLGFAAYVFALGRVDGMALNHRENLISNLGRRE
jgi:ABC-2 type transport system permease protein